MHPLDYPACTLGRGGARGRDGRDYLPLLGRVDSVLGPMGPHLVPGDLPLSRRPTPGRQAPYRSGVALERSDERTPPSGPAGSATVHPRRLLGVGRARSFGQPDCPPTEPSGRPVSRRPKRRPRWDLRRLHSPHEGGPSSAPVPRRYCRLHYRLHRGNGPSATDRSAPHETRPARLRIRPSSSPPRYRAPSRADRPQGS